MLAINVNEIIKKHIHFAKKIANEVVRKVGFRVPKEDIIQGALLGLCQAAKTYDFARATSFAAFAAHRIRGAAYDEVSFYLKEQKHLDKRETEKQYDPGLDQLNSCRSFVLESSSMREFSELECEMVIDNLIRCLDGRSKFIIRALYNGSSQQEIAKDIGVSQGRLSQLLVKLHYEMRKNETKRAC